MKNICVCDFDECKLYLENPIALSCGSTICKEHIDNYDYEHTFKCLICDEEHTVPENGYQINKTLLKIINSGLHLNEIQRSTIESFKKLDSILNQYNSIDSETMIYDYFFNIRNKVDLHRERLIEEINERSNDIINELNMLEKECKLNAAKLNKISNLKSIDLSLWKSQLRMPDINLNKINNLYDNINTIIKEIQSDMENYKNDLLMDRNIEFSPLNNNLFGKLKIKCNDIKFTDDFGSCIRTYGEHSSLVRTFQVDEISKKIITGSTDNTIKIWNLETGECLKTLEDHKGWVTSILLYNDNKFISCSDDKTIKIWSLDSYECLNTLTSDLGVFSICFLADNILASGCYSGRINIWNLNNFSLIHSFDAHKEIVSCLKLTKDNSKLVSCSSDCSIKIWNIKTFECVLTLAGHCDYIYCLELTANGQLLSGSEDKTIRLWDLETGECLKKIDLNAEIYSLKLLSKDILVIGSSSKENILIYSMKNNEVVKKIDLHNDLVFCLNILENGRLISASRDKTIKMWKI